ncbi:hypothetical protein [Pseudoneobacillus sp. C159]
MSVTITEELHGLITVLHLTRTLDLKTSEIVENYVTEMKEVDLLIFDFSKTETIPPNFMNTIKKVIFLSRVNKFTLKLEGTSDRIFESFQRAGIYQNLKTANTMIG